MNIARTLGALALLTGAVVAADTALADPCGMVPPIRIPDGQQMAIRRIGAQRTYVMHHAGVEVIALRPGFAGSVDEFGMLIPFPAPPAIRKIDDGTFAQLENAIDPPTVNIRIMDAPPPMPQMSETRSVAMKATAEPAAEPPLGFNDVRVLREEAVGMYTVAVLEAGSADALRKWMDKNGYRFPGGMEGVTQEYVEIRWCFVAVKARVQQGPGVEPRPGMRETNPKLPDGATFDGYVQGMAFRFPSERAVVPMRLSVFNGPDPRNVVYVVADEPLKMAGMSSNLVVRQVSGEQLHKNLTQPLPLVVTGGQLGELQATEIAQIERMRDATPYVKVARELFGADLLAIRTNTLSLPFEEEEKELLDISEGLGLRGDAIDRSIGAAIAEKRQQASAQVLPGLKPLHLSVIDGVLDGQVLASTNLGFEPYRIDRARNVRRTDELRAQDMHRTFYRRGGWWR